MADSQRHARIKELFLAARELHGDRRAEYLGRECGDDDALRDEVESLLKFDDPQTILSRDGGQTPASPSGNVQTPRGAKAARDAKTAMAYRSGERLLRRRSEPVTRAGARLLGTKRRFVVGALGAVVFLAGLGVWAHWGILRSLKQMREQELQTLLDANITALKIWMQDEKGDALVWAREPQLRRDVQELANVARASESPAADLLKSPAMASLRKTLENYLAEKGNVAYGVVDRSGLVLAADDDRSVGAHLSPEQTAFNALVFEGKTSFTQPTCWGGTFQDSSAAKTVPVPVPLWPEGDRHIFRPEMGRKMSQSSSSEASAAKDPPAQDEEPLIWMNTPVRDDRDQIVASLNFGMRADHQFGQILSVARMGKTGESYAFNKNAVMISESRFTEQLKSVGLVEDKPEARSMLTVLVRDPGGDMTSGHRPDLTTMAAWPLTKMAALATAGHDGSDLDGYRDYRGRTVVGAWKWLGEYDFGVAAEVDVNEAYAPIWYLDASAGILLGLLSLALCAFLVSQYRIARLQREVGEARRLGQYTLEERIGAGGMGEVYKARHAMLRRPTAIKLLKSDQATEERIARFEREVQLASQLTHPNTIAIYDYGRTPDGTFYFAMEYVDGVTLAELIRREGAIPAPRAIHILRQACGSLSEAHAMGLIHRDIKPLNIMLCQRGGESDVVKVLDFGLAKDIASTATEITGPAVISGTPLYIPPERFKNPQGGDARSDLYALGAVGYNLLTARNIFECSTDMDLLFHVMNVPPASPSEYVDGAIPPKLEKLIMDCLAKDPAERPQSAREMIAVLDSIRKDSES